MNDHLSTHGATIMKTITEPQDTLSLVNGLEPVQSLYDEKYKIKTVPILVPTQFPFRFSSSSPYECIDKNTMSKQYNTFKTYTPYNPVAMILMKIVMKFMYSLS